MSLFEENLRAARKRQGVIYLLLGAILLVSVIIGVLFFLYSRGTAIKLMPPEISGLGQIRVSEGWAISLFNSVYSISKYPKIEVRAKGYQEKTIILEPNSQGRNINVELQPLPGILKIKSVPAHEGTQWYLSGELIATGAVLEKRLQAGQHSIIVDNPFFKIETVSPLIHRAEVTYLDLDLTPVSGVIRISTAPPNARVFLNNKYIGTTPLEKFALGGYYNIRIEEKKFKTILEDFTLTNDEPFIRRNYNLHPVSGLLNIITDPPGGILLLNGKKITKMVNLPVDTGDDQVLTYDLAGYQPFFQAFSLKAHEVKTINIKLLPEMGVVHIASIPSSEIIIDKKKVGETPASLSLLAKQTKIELRRAGYVSLEKLVTPTSQHATLINETLVSGKVAKLAATQKTYTNSVGMDMVLFYPSKFSMGGARYEKGQRGNEFLRIIQLIKPFYASKYETTNLMFNKFTKDKLSIKNPTHPVTSVSWMDAAKFCNWLSETENLTPFYKNLGKEYQGTNSNSNGYRLLTEAEWEWLARKAGKIQQSLFPWGDSAAISKPIGNIADEKAKHVARFFVPKYHDNFAYSSPVGSFPVEPSGLYDLAGNVSEWVHDYYTLVPPNSVNIEIDPMGPKNGDVHVVKGSNWGSGTLTTLRAAYREGVIGVREDLGFRVGRYRDGVD